MIEIVAIVLIVSLFVVPMFLAFTASHNEYRMKKTGDDKILLQYSVRSYWYDCGVFDSEEHARRWIIERRIAAANRPIIPKRPI